MIITNLGNLSNDVHFHLIVYGELCSPLCHASVVRLLVGAPFVSAHSPLPVVFAYKKKPTI